MANIGLKNARFNLIDYTTKKYKELTNSKVPVLGRIIDSKFAPEYNNTELYADDTLAESDNSFKKATVNITVDNDSDEIVSILLGHEFTTDGEVIEFSENEAPEIGYGQIITKKVKGKKVYKGEFLPRVKVTKITTDAKTRGESVEFGTTAIEGVAYALNEEINGMKEGTYRRYKTFDTEKEASEYIEKLLSPINTATTNTES